MTHSTVYSNTAAADDPATGVIYVHSGTATLKNTIVASNPGGNCDAAVTDGGGNLQYGDDTCGASIPTGDPKLGMLSDNGGSTPTMALPMDSPAVDACACTSVADDQRGEPRPFDWMAVDNETGACDIGAYEKSGGRVYLPAVLKASQ